VEEGSAVVVLAVADTPEAEAGPVLVAVVLAELLISGAVALVRRP